MTSVTCNNFNYFKLWYVFLIIFLAFSFNNITIQVGVAMVIGEYAFFEALKDSLKTNLTYFPLSLGFLLPYISITVVLHFISKTKLKEFMIPVLIGGIFGILVWMGFGFWHSFVPFYTGKHIQSTWMFGLPMIPLYSIFVGIVCALICCILYYAIAQIFNLKTNISNDDLNEVRKVLFKGWKFK